MPSAKNIDIIRCVVLPLHEREMVFLNAKNKPESRAIHVATLQAFARGRSRIYVYFYKETNHNARYLEERTVYNYGGQKIINYEQVIDDREAESVIEYLRDYLWKLYQKGKTIDVIGVECKEPIPFFFDLNKGKLDREKETNTEEIIK